MMLGLADPRADVVKVLVGTLQAYSSRQVTTLRADWEPSGETRSEAMVVRPTDTGYERCRAIGMAVTLGMTFKQAQTELRDLARHLGVEL